MISSTLLFSSVEEDLRLLTENLKQLVGARHPILYAAAEYLFGTKGKRVRPAIVLLIARTTMPDRPITEKHRRLAEITEMIHTASLVHDDVVDESDLRRGVPTVHSRFNNRVAVLAGDFLFAQSSWHLANLDNLPVVKLLSEVIMDLAEGEIQQGLNGFDTSLSIEAYLEKSYYKTASLIANSSKAAGCLSEVSTETLGKPAGSDLRSGNLTAPALFCLEEKPYLEVLIEREFAEEGDLEQALALVEDSKGIERSRELATHHAQKAVEYLAPLPHSESRQALIDLADYVLS